GVSSAPKSSASKTWRISISDSPGCGFGQRFTHSIASSSDFTWNIQKPATSCCVSAKGPFTTVRSLPENFTRAPFADGCRPSPASMTPAFTSSSLYRVISVSSVSLGITPASLSLVALTMTMNRMARVLLLPWSRTGSHPIDRPAYFFRVRGHPPAAVGDERGQHAHDEGQQRPRSGADHEPDHRGPDHDDGQPGRGQRRQPGIDPQQARQDQAEPAEDLGHTDEVQEPARHAG